MWIIQRRLIWENNSEGRRILKRTVVASFNMIIIKVFVWRGEKNHENIRQLVSGQQLETDISQE